MNHVFINVLRYFWYVVKLYYYYLNVLHLKAYSCLVPKICRQNLYTSFGTIVYVVSWVSRRDMTRRPASTDRTARRQFQATGQPVSRTQSSDAMTSRLPRYEAKCVQRRCFQCGSVPLRSDVKGTELPPANILIPLDRQLIALQPCSWEFLYNETFQQTFRPLLSKLSKRRQI